MWIVSPITFFYLFSFQNVVVQATRRLPSPEKRPRVLPPMFLPGPGFGKRAEDGIQMMENNDEILGIYPIAPPIVKRAFLVESAIPQFQSDPEPQPQIVIPRRMVRQRPVDFDRYVLDEWIEREMRGPPLGPILIKRAPPSSLPMIKRASQLMMLVPMQEGPVAVPVERMRRAPPSGLPIMKRAKWVAMVTNAGAPSSFPVMKRNVNYLADLYTADRLAQDEPWFQYQ